MVVLSITKRDGQEMGKLFVLEARRGNLRRSLEVVLQVPIEERLTAQGRSENGQRDVQMAKGGL